MGGERRTAGLLIIGDEILSAKVEDANTRFLCTELRSIGWTVEKVSQFVGVCVGCVRQSTLQHIQERGGGRCRGNLCCEALLTKATYSCQLLPAL